VPIASITMPRWGLTMQEGKVAAWLVGVGDSVTAGMEVLEVESSKLVGPVEATASGILRRQLVPLELDFPVGTLLGVIADESVADDAIDAFIASFKPIERDVQAAEDAAPLTVVVDGINISYVRKGESGMPVLLLHGFGGDSGGWGLLQASLSSAHDVIAVDLPGHGASDKRLAGPSLSDQARFVARFLETIGIDRAHVVGHSMGGGIALALTLMCAAKVASLTLLAPAGLGPEINVGYLKDFVAAERRKDVEAALERLFAQRHFVSRALAENVTKYKRQDGVRAALDRLLEGFVRGAGQAENFRSGLPQIDVPIVILWGLDDRIIPASHADAMPAGVVVERIEGVGHMPHVEAADTVVRRIRALLRS